MTELSEDLRPHNGEALHRLLAIDRAVDATYGLAHRFRRLVRDHDEDGLGPWLDRAGAGASRSFTASRIDSSATGPPSMWPSRCPESNGQTEGQITQLKLLKRQMYGRASLDLLRRRVPYRG